MLTFQKYYCLDSIRNFFTPKRNRKTIMGCGPLSLLQHHPCWIREMTTDAWNLGRKYSCGVTYTDCYFLLFLRFSVRFLQQKWKYRHLLSTLSPSLYYVLETGFLFVPVCRGKAKWSLKVVSLKLSNLTFSAFATRQTETSVSSPRTLKVYLLTIKHKGSP